MTRKRLGTGRLSQAVDYAYNIRGWLTRLNDPYQPNKEDLLNLSLHYETGFTDGYAQYGGNLTGQTWRGRDGVQRAYGYIYDPLNRLLQGDFVARAGGSLGTLTTATAWNQERDNYRLSFVSYDDNGNIATLRRRGLLQAGTSRQGKQYGAVDNLTYAYQGNRLQAVDDAVTGNQLPQPASYHGAPTSLAGDFQEAGVKLGQEYLYDANGNLTADQNKGLTGIGYNHLNLPRQIRFGQGADSVVFRYAASGQKVAKLVYQTGKPLLRTDYLGPYQYEQDSLKFFPHAEGRVLRFVATDPAGQATVRYQREYTLKDHLGNLRLAYRAGQVRTLNATLEQDETTHQRESQQFDSLSVSAPVAQATSLARSGAYAARLNAGGSAPQPLGPLTQLGVQKGDTITVTAYGLYPQAQQHGFLFSLGSFLASLFHPAQAPPPGLEARKRQDLPLLQVGVAAGLTAIPQLSGGVPQAYVRVLVFNRDSALVDQLSQQLTKAAQGNYEPLRLQVVLPQDGYVSAYVGSQSDVDVFFDDVRVEHRPGLQVQETQYDPAGLELAGLAPPSPGIRGLNNYRFNGKEFQADLGLAWNHQDWRFFDPQLLRWHSGDPEIENGQESWTPYSFGYDNAVRYSDADGRCPCEGSWGSLGSYVNGVVAAVSDNLSMGLVNRRASMGNSTSDANAHAFNAGQDAGDRLMIFVGGVEVGAALALTAVVGAGEVGSGGAATPAVAVSVPVLAGMAAHGYGMARNATARLTDQNGRINASSSTSGENSSAAKGRQAHRNYNPGSTYTTDPKNTRLANGKIPDAVDFKNKVVRELKPNNARAIKRGEKQVESYRKQLQKENGGKWKGHVDTY